MTPTIKEVSVNRPTRLDSLAITAAEHSPHNAALRIHESTWTYSDLHTWSNRMAWWLLNFGITPRTRIAIWAHKSCEVIACTQAILRIGCSYVPIDPLTPIHRANELLDLCNVKLVIAERSIVKNWLSDARINCFLLDTHDSSNCWRSIERLSTCSPNDPEGSIDDEAYVLCTSGSTGTPKAIRISHRNALSFVRWAVDRLDIRAGNRFANYSSLSFDLSVFDFYCAFATASVVCMMTANHVCSPTDLVTFIRKERINIWYSVPSVLVLMLDSGALLKENLPDLKIIIFAGEPFPIKHFRALRTICLDKRLFNFYGPTETNVCSSYEIESSGWENLDPIPIGNAASNASISLIKSDGTRPRVGELGELWVMGPSVMMGYIGEVPHSGYYRTGDLCFQNDDGTLSFHGRTDRMVKINGYRVDLAEIEAKLLQHPAVREVCVVPAVKNERRFLTAYLKCDAGTALSLLEIKMFLARLLPAYMTINRLYQLPSLPRTPNGKIDTSCLNNHLYND